MIAFIAGLMSSVAVIWFALMISRRSRVVLLMPQRSRSNVPHVSTLLESIGYKLFRRFLISAEMARSVGLIVLIGPVIAIRSWLFALIISGCLIALPPFIYRRKRLERRLQIERDLPTFVDMLSLAMQSGQSLRSAAEFVSSSVEGPIAHVFRTHLQGLSRGRRMVEVLQKCRDELGSETDHFFTMLLSAERFGAPLVELLTQYSHDIRFQQQNRAERVARQLSVQLLFPVAGCVLPAFALLTAAPLLAGSIGTLATSFH